jgi:hypothetical protein
MYDVCNIDCRPHSSNHSTHLINFSLPLTVITKRAFYSSVNFASCQSIWPQKGITVRRPLLHPISEVTALNVSRCYRYSRDNRPQLDANEASVHSAYSPVLSAANITLGINCNCITFLSIHLVLLPFDRTGWPGAQCDIVWFGHSLLWSCIHETCTAAGLELSDQHSNSELSIAVLQLLHIIQSVGPRPPWEAISCSASKISKYPLSEGTASSLSCRREPQEMSSSAHVAFLQHSF